MVRTLVRRTTAVAVSLALLASAAIGASAPASAVSGNVACTIGAAPTIPVGPSVTWDSAGCDQNMGWARISLNAGDVVTFNVQSPDGSSFLMWTPNATDFNWTTDEVDALGCNKGGYAFWQFQCQVTRSGNWVVSMTGRGSLTASVVRQAPQAGRVQGTCTIVGAPLAPDRVTQFGDAGCRPQHGIVWWRLRIVRGDHLTFRLKGVQGWGIVSQVTVNVWRPSATDFTVWTQASLYPCEGSAYAGSPQTLDCKTMPSTGTYYVGLRDEGTFTPVITHAVAVSATAPKKLKSKKYKVVRAALTSPAGSPRGTCVVQRLAGGRWKNAGRTSVVVGGVCSPQARVVKKGLVKLRVQSKGATGWATATSRPFTVRVR